MMDSNTRRRNHARTSDQAQIYEDIGSAPFLTIPVPQLPESPNVMAAISPRRVVRSFKKTPQPIVAGRYIVQSDNHFTVSSINQASRMSALPNQENFPYLGPMHTPTNIVVATFEYKFSIFPRHEHDPTSHVFTLLDDPKDWPKINGLKNLAMQGTANIRASLKGVSKTENSASKLLWIIMWASVFCSRPLQSGEFGYWEKLRTEAISLLFTFHATPDRYLCRLRGDFHLFQGHLGGRVGFHMDRAFFTIDAARGLGWISYADYGRMIGDRIWTLDPLTVTIV